jgi:hypothetical protein
MTTSAAGRAKRDYESRAPQVGMVFECPVKTFSLSRLFPTMPLQAVVNFKAYREARQLALGPET